MAKIAKHPTWVATYRETTKGEQLAKEYSIRPTICNLDRWTIIGGPILSGRGYYSVHYRSSDLQETLSMLTHLRAYRKEYYAPPWRYWLGQMY